MNYNDIRKKFGLDNTPVAAVPKADTAPKAETGYAAVRKKFGLEQSNPQNPTAPVVSSKRDYDADIFKTDSEIKRLQEQYNRIYNGDVNVHALESWYTDYSTSAPSTRIDPDLDAANLKLYNELRGEFDSFADIQRRIEELKAEKWKLENEKKYSAVSANADFAEKSKVTQTEATSNVFDGLLKNSKSHYDIINGLLKIDKVDALKKSGNPFVTGYADYISDNLHYMKDEEKKVYNYLYNTQGADSAEEYLDYLKGELGGRAAKYSAKEWEELAHEFPTQTSIMSIPMNLWSGVGYVDVALQKAANDAKEAATGEYAGPVNYNTFGTRLSKNTSAIRGTVAQDLVDQYGAIDLDEETHPVLSKVLNGKSWGDVYQLGMSMADSATVAAVSPVLGTAGTMLLAGSAATSTMLDAVEKGATDEQALAMGALSGAFEYIFEKYELENLLGADTNILKAVTNQALTEAVGEGATGIANFAADTFVMAEKSDWQQNIQKYMTENPGMTEAEARKLAFTDAAIQIGWDAVGGMLSGGLMGGGTSAIKGVSTKLEQNEQGSQHATQSGENAQVGNGQAVRENAAEPKPGTLEWAQGLMELGKSQGNAQNGAQSAPKTAFEIFEDLLSRGANAPADPVGAAVEAFSADGTVTNKQAQQQTAVGSEMAQKNAVQENGNKYQLRDYSQQQKDNWRNSKRIVLYEGVEQFKNFIKNALSSKSLTNKKLYFGAVDSDLASAISTETGVNVEGYNLALGENEIRKINKDHGSELTEAPRGQRAITEADYLNIPNVVQSPDSINLSSKLYEGKPVIEFRKTNGNETTVVSAVVSDKRLDLFIQTTYVNKKRGSIATPESEQADSNTPEATGGTAPNKDVTQTPAEGKDTNHETNAQSASASPSSINSISQTYPGVNTYSGKTAEVENTAENTAVAAPSDSVGAAPSGFDVNTVGGVQSRFDRKQNTSRVYSNTYTNATDEGLRKIGKETKAADPNIDKYDVITEAESIHNAELRTRNDDEIEFEYEELCAKSGWSGEDNDTAHRILKHLLKSGDTERYTALARKVEQEGTRSGQLVQSFAKYSRMSATDCVQDVVSTVDKLTPSDVSSRHYKQQGFNQWKQSVIKTSMDIANQIDSVEDGDVESMKDIIRSLAKFRKTTAWFGMSSDLTKIANGALKDIDFNTAKAIANAQLSTLPKDFQKRPVGQVIKTIRIHNMLSALTTVNRNLAGNASIGIIDAVSDSTVGRCLDSLVSLATHKRTVGNDVAHAKTYFEGASKAANLAALCTELDIPLDSESRFSTGTTRTYSPQGGAVTRFLSAFEKSMRYALEVTDQFFDGGTNAVIEKSLDNLGSKANLTADEAAKIAELVGKRRTFKDDRAMARAAKGVKKGLNELGTGNIGMGDMVLPFAGTGSNVGQAAIDYSSLGVGGFIDIFRLMYDVKKGKYENGVKKVTKNGKVVREISLVEAQRQAVSNAARGLTGTGLIAAFAALAAAGILGVHDDEDKDKRGLEQSLNLSGAQLNVDAAMRWVRGESTNWQDSDWCLSIDFLEPFNAQMYVGYLLSQEDSIQDMAKSYPHNAVAGVYQSVMDMPMMQGLSDFSDLVTNVGSTVSEGGNWQDTMVEAGGQLLGNAASGFIPSWVRQTAQVIDPYYRDTTGDTAGERAVNQILAMVPFASQTLPKKYSGLGQEQRRYEDLLPGVFNTMVNPGELEQIKSSEIADYLDELSERTGDVTFYPAYIAPGSFTMDGEKVAISGKENTEKYQGTYGTNVNRLYGQLIKNRDFLAATDKVQAEILNSAKSYAVMLAKAEVSDYSEIPSYIKNRASGMSEAEAILRHELLVKSNGDPVYKNTEKYSYLSVSDADYVTGLLEGLKAQNDKVNAIASSKLSENDQKSVLKDTLSERAYDKFMEVLKLGMDVDDYAASYDMYKTEDSIGGKGTKERTIAQYQKEFGISYSTAKSLYEIYNPK